MSLTLLLDSADIEEWSHWSKYGIFQGITTNPSLLKKAKQPCTLSNVHKLTQYAQQLGYKEIHIQACGKTSKKLTDSGISIGELEASHIKIFVKLPVTDIGTEAAREITKKNIPITFTACYEPSQILIASSLGIDYIAPYLGRMNDKDGKGLEKILTMQSILNGVGSCTKLLVASIRSKNEMIALASKGVTTFTIQPSIAKELFNSRDTIESAKIFEQDCQFI